MPASETQECYKVSEGLIHIVYCVWKVNAYEYPTKAIKIFVTFVIFVKSVTLVILTSLGY